jgi:cyclase
MSLNRRQFLITSSMACATTALAPHFSTLAQSEAAAFEPLRRNVGKFTGSGGTIGWLVSKDGMVIVDSQYPESAKACLDGLRHRSARTIDALINTHHHGDHTGGNGVFRPAAKIIVAHEKVPGLQKASAAEKKDAPEPTVADTTFSESWSLDLGSEKVTARHYLPAHTAGDCIVHFQEADVVHMGDLVFDRWHPFIDRPGGASLRGWAQTLHDVAETYTSETLFNFGHGKKVTGSREDLKEHRNYLLAVLDAARKGERAGKSLAEVTKQNSLPGFDDYEPHGERLTLTASLTAAYEELSTGEP